VIGLLTPVLQIEESHSPHLYKKCEENSGGTRC
jgi:hypothetical protein